MTRLFRILTSIFKIGPVYLFGLAAVLIGTGIWQMTQGGIGNLPLIGDLVRRSGVDLTAPALTAAALFSLCLKAGGALAILGLIKSAVRQMRKPGEDTPETHRATSLEDEIGRPSYLAKIPETAKPKRVYAFQETLQRRTGQSLGPAATGRQAGGFGAALRNVVILACLGGLGLVGASVLFGSPAGTPVASTEVAAAALPTPVASPDIVPETAATDRATARVFDLFGDAALAAQAKTIITQTLEWVQTSGRVWLNRTIDDAIGGDMVAQAKVGAMVLGGFLFLMKFKTLMFERKRRRPRQSIHQFG